MSLYEVFRVVRRERGEGNAVRAAALMDQGREFPLTSAFALAASRPADERRPTMADGIILATARSTGAVLWARDADFEGVAGLRYFAKIPNRGRPPG